MSQDPLVITPPPWIDEAVASFSASLDSDHGRMGLAIYLAGQNAQRGGGPFGAAVFVGDSLVGVGVNQVLDTGLSIAHAEVLALARAQQTVDGWEAAPRGPFTLVTSAEPCCQCFGALIWAGVERMVCGANTEDVQAIGFDEGPKPDRWLELLESRAISVAQGVRREEAREVLNAYLQRGGAIYGPRVRT
jgi:tRNA(Arg) A34 adenosine deaminase TadA